LTITNHFIILAIVAQRGRANRPNNNYNRDNSPFLRGRYQNQRTTSVNISPIIPPIYLPPPPPLRPTSPETLIVPAPSPTFSQTRTSPPTPGSIRSGSISPIERI